MCNDDKLFAEIKYLKQPQKVTLGDGHILNATGIGVVKLQANLGNGKTIRCKLHNVLYVPQLFYNLFSVSRAAEKGKTTSFSKDSCQVIDANNKLVATASKVGSLYYLNCQTSHQVNVAKDQCNEIKEDVWHRRLGHLGEQNLQKLAKNELAVGFDYDVSKEIHFCEPCAQGKHHRSRFPSKRSEEPLGLVHSDVCGKINTKSLSGAEYFVTFIDDKTHFVWMYVLKHKSQVFEKFLEWKAMVERSTGRKLKTLRTDNGGEYTSTQFGEYLRSEGIRHELTVPKTPQQNGVAERMNRTLIETVRSMLADTKLPHMFWAEALATAVYLRNRSPTKAVERMTPFEAWNGEKPKLDHLRTFGCASYAHVAKDERQKLDSKATKCVLLGYGSETKGYRLYDLKRLKVFYSRDVLFCESERGFEKERSVQERRYVEIDCSRDEEPVPVPVSDINEVAEPTLRRSTRERHPPDYYRESVAIVSLKEKEMESLKAKYDQDRANRWIFNHNTGADSPSLV